MALTGMIKGTKLSAEEKAARAASLQETMKLQSIAKRVSLQILLIDGALMSLYAYCEQEGIRYKTALAKVVASMPATFKGSIYQADYSVLKSVKCQSGIKWLVPTTTGFAVEVATVRPLNAICAFKGNFVYSQDGKNFTRLIPLVKGKKKAKKKLAAAQAEAAKLDPSTL